MAKAKKALSMLLVVLMAMFTFMSYVPAKAASILPEVKFVGLENIPAAVGEEQTLMLTSNYTGDVQYRVFYLQRDDASKKQVEGWKALGDWTPAADAKTPVEVKVPAGTITKAGNYSFAVRVKIAGTEGTYSNNYGGYDSAYAFNYVFAAEATEGLKAAKLEKNEVVAGEKFVISGLKAGESYRLFTLNENRAQRWDKDPVATSVTDKIEWAPAEAGNYVLDLQIMKDGKVDAVKLFNVKVAAKPAELKVESVSATNLKEAVVNFNIPVDKDTVVDANFKVVDKNGATVPTTVVLLEDGKTVAVTAAAKFGNQETYKLTVANLKSADGIKLDKTEKEFTAFDRELPEVKDVVITGPKSFTLVFSEPIEASGKVDVRTGNSVIGVATINNTEDIKSNKVFVNLYSTLEDGKTYTVSVKDFKDYAEYNNVIFSQDVKYAKDNNAPTATVVKAEQNYVVVKFDKPVKGLTKDHFYHTFSAWTAFGIYTDEAMTKEVDANKPVETVYVKFYNDGKDKANEHPIAEGTTKLVINAKDVVDNWDNKFAGAELPITVSADKEAPQVKELTVSTETALKVKFTKPVQFNEDNVEIFDKDGKKIDGVKISVKSEDDAKKVYTIGFGKNLAGKTIIVNLKDVVDFALTPNKLATYTATLEVTDKTAPEINKVTYANGTDGCGILYVFFDEDVDPETALNAGNYYFVNGTTFTQLSGDAAFFNGSSIVKIELSKSEYASIQKDGVKIFVTNVKDIAKNAMTGQFIDRTAETIFPNENNKPSVAKVVAKDTHTVEVTFKEYLTAYDKDAFNLVVDGESVKPTSMTVSTNSSGNSVITLTTDKNIAYDASNVKLTIKLEGKYSIKNVFGVNIDDVTDKVATDGIAPAIAKVSDKLDVNAKAGERVIKVTFTEKIDPNSLSMYTFAVKDMTVKSVTLDADGKTVLITLPDTEDAFVEGQELVITQENNVSDMVGNASKYDKAIEIKVAK